MSLLFNRVKMSVGAAPGTGTVLLASALIGFQSFAAAGVADGNLVSYLIEDGANWEAGVGTYVAAATSLGRTTIVGSSSGGAPINVSANASVSLTELAQDIVTPQIMAAALFGHLSGLTLANDTTSSNTTIDIAAGAAASDDASAIIVSPNALKKTTSAWAVGSGNGGLDTGAIATSKWYHTHLIQRPDTGAVDALLSLSASAPTMPANYTKKRRIGAIKTDSSGNILKFFQDGDIFLWPTLLAETGSVQVPTTLSNVVSLQWVPPGVRTVALLAVQLSQQIAGAYSLWIGSADFPAPSSFPGATMFVYASSAAGGASWGTRLQQQTDITSKIRVVANETSASQLVSISTEGFIDRRGK